MSNKISLEQHIQNTHEPLKLEILQQAIDMLNAGDGKLFPVDLYAIGIANRAVSLADGFFAMMEVRNFIAAAPLVRMQLDCALRLSAVWLVEEPHQFARNIMKGGQVKKEKDRNGRQMHDSYLVTQLKEQFPWVENVYKETSGFVHFSEKHIFSAFASISEDRTAQIAITGIGNFPPEIYFEAIEAFKAATKIILYFFKGWKKTKDRG